MSNGDFEQSENKNEIERLFFSSSSTKRTCPIDMTTLVKDLPLIFRGCDLFYRYLKVEEAKRSTRRSTMTNWNKNRSKSRRRRRRFSSLSYSPLLNSHETCPCWCKVKSSFSFGGQHCISNKHKWTQHLLTKRKVFKIRFSSTIFLSPENMFISKTRTMINIGHV